MRRGAVVAAVAAVLLTAACTSTGAGGEPADLPPSATPSSPATSTPAPSSPATASPGSASAASSPSASDRADSTPRPVGRDQRFALDDVAEFGDGLQIEIAGTSADKAKPDDRGAKATDGQIVIASVRIENATGEDFFAGDVLVSAWYGGSAAGGGRDAQIIVDPTEELQDGFDGTIAKGDEAVVGVGFAVPADQLGSVTFVVDCADDEHDAVSFTGRVERS